MTKETGTLSESAGRPYLAGDQSGVFIALGSNLGDRQVNLRDAISRIDQLGWAAVRRSSVYETEPVGLKDQPHFLNQVIQVERPAGASPEPGLPDSDQATRLLTDLLEIEEKMGRPRVPRAGPRVIDLDLLFFGQLSTGNVSESATADQLRGTTELVLPHPRLHMRRFVLEPLCEISPGLNHPLFNMTCRELLDALEDRSVVRLYSPS